jgi:beta-glucosidase
MVRMTRRGFAGSIAALSLAGASTQATGRTAAGTPRAASFPKGFLWGCATSAYQSEGAAQADGRGPSLWDTFSHTPGTTHDGATGDVADDSYHRYREDVQLLANLGAKAYRFSISWSRVIPEGRGKVNPLGLDYYDRFVDELLRHGIEPWPTLFHWDTPQALKGGWQSRDTAYAFADYSGLMAKRLSDRVHQFMTTNEFTCFTDKGYKAGEFAPGLKLADGEVAQIRHHAILAHGLAVQSIRAHASGGTQVGMAENPSLYVPVIDTREHVEAAKKALREENAPFLTAVMEGKYSERYLQKLGPNAPKVASGDMAIISSPLDFLGLNVYQPEYVRAAATSSGYEVVSKPDSFPRVPSPWLYVGPEVIYWAVRNVSELYGLKAIYITENGCSAADVPDAEGRVQDIDRVMFLRNYLTQLQRAAAEGYPVRGYFVWSLLDNFEWGDGYTNRFGIHYVDYKTLKRTPKLSAQWYREVIAQNAVL